MNKVLIIDDDRFMQNMLQKSLFKHYEVRTADDGPGGIHLARTWLPNVILLDVEMPGKNGYEVCDELKQNSETQDIPVVFLSSHNTTREHLLGYEVGGDDFLVKPCSQEVLHKKLSLLAEYFHQKSKLKHSVDSAEQTALEALTTSFELGKAVRFVERTHTFASFDALGVALMDVMKDFDLSACAIIITQECEKFYSTQGAVAPLEMDILSKLHSDQRFVDFGCRTQVNFPQVGLLIKNMPLKERIRYGRIKDSLPFILGAADAKIRVLEAEIALRGQNQHLIKSIQLLENQLSSINQKLSKGQMQTRQIMAELTEELSLHLHRLGLEQDQEEYVLGKVDLAADALHDNLLESEPIGQTLADTIRLLQDLAAVQHKVINEKLSSNSSQDLNWMNNHIELF